MLLFRSEEDVEQWCKETGRNRGEIVPLEQVWRLSQRWYATRMDADYRGRSREQVEAIFEEVGLKSSFWKFSP